LGSGSSPNTDIAALPIIDADARAGVAVEPLKLVALLLAGKGHWLSGTGMILGAYAASLLCVERLFRIVKPKLMMMDWFAKGWTWFTWLRDKSYGWAKGVISAD
jgi:hypothetical protein